MSYEFLEDGVTSDVTFVARAPTLEELFRSAAEATTSVMVRSPERLGSAATVAVRVEAEALDLLLLRYLEELVYRKDVDGLLLRPGELRIDRDAHLCRLEGTLVGEPLDPARHQLEADVKAVTLAGLRVESCPGGWEAQVTLDV